MLEQRRDVTAPCGVSESAAQAFFVSLVMLSIVTSLAAGSWLERVADRPAGAGRQPQQEAAEVPGELSAT
jgi:hypothetical protein